MHLETPFRLKSHIIDVKLYSSSYVDTRSDIIIVTIVSIHFISLQDLPI